MNPPPNILLVVTDQQHPDLAGFTGKTAVRTPHLDRLAAEGTVFSRAYSACPLCTPSRASMLSGQYPSRHGAWSIGTDTPDDVTSVAALLSDAGYLTGIVGKSHFKSCERPGSFEAPPHSRDWDFFRRWSGPWFGFQHARIGVGHVNEPHAYSMHYGLFLHENGIPPEPPYFGKLEPGWDWALPEKFHSSTWVADEAIAFLENRANAPFFLSVNFPDPHVPFRVPGAWRERYADAPVPRAKRVLDEIERNATTFYRANVENRAAALGWHQSQPPPNHGRHPVSEGLERSDWEVEAWRTYMAMQELVDHNLGRILDELDRRGIAGNTLVIFTSDHGDMMGNHWLWSKGDCHYDDCTRVPFVVRWPGHVAAGRRSDALVSLVDLAPTFLTAAGLGVDPSMQGVDLTKTLRSGDPAREGVWIDHRVEHGLNVNTWITARHRLSLHAIHAERREEAELYDLGTDPDELHNIAAEHPALVAELAQQMIRHIASVQGPWQVRPVFA